MAEFEAGRGGAREKQQGGPSGGALAGDRDRASRGRPQGAEQVLIISDGTLEGLLEWPEVKPGLTKADGRERDKRPPRGGLVVAHPHPLYGGTMAQPVVYRIAKACREGGWVTLRFNFRGVGRSSGAYSGVAEYRDVEAALRYLRTRLQEATAVTGERRSGPVLPAPVAVAGYSFGSIMAAMAAGQEEVPVDALILVAFAVTWPELPGELFALLGRFRGPVLAVCGEKDELAPPEEVAQTLAGLGLEFRLEVIPGSGHLFEGKQNLVGESIARFLASTFPRLVFQL